LFEVASWVFARSRKRQAFLDKFRYFELIRKPFITRHIKLNRSNKRVLLSRSWISGSKLKYKHTFQLMVESNKNIQSRGLKKWIRWRWPGRQIYLALWRQRSINFTSPLWFAGRSSNQAYASKSILDKLR